MNLYFKRKSELEKVKVEMMKNSLVYADEEEEEEDEEVIDSCVRAAEDELASDDDASECLIDSPIEIGVAGVEPSTSPNCPPELTGDFERMDGILDI